MTIHAVQTKKAWRSVKEKPSLISNEVQYKFEGDLSSHSSGSCTGKAWKMIQAFFNVNLNLKCFKLLGRNIK